MASGTFPMEAWMPGPRYNKVKQISSRYSDTLNVESNII